MMNLFFSNKANNNEDFKSVIKVRMNRMVLIFMIGIFTFFITFLTKYIWKDTISNEMLFIYSCFGLGLSIFSVVLWIKNKRILTDDQKLKENRLINTDERIQEINMKAYKIATVVLLISLYAVGLIGGLLYPVLANVSMTLICIFLLGYLIAFKSLEKRM